MSWLKRKSCVGFFQEKNWWSQEDSRAYRVRRKNKVPFASSSSARVSPLRWASSHTVWQQPRRSSCHSFTVGSHLQKQNRSCKESAFALESGNSCQAKVKKNNTGWLVFIWPGIHPLNPLLISVLHVSSFQLQGSFLTLVLPLFLSQISANEIEMLLMRLPRMFKQEFTGVGATLEKRWKFCAFEGIKTIWLWLVMKLCRRIPRAWQGYKVLK